jgi:proteic killer suppression protein
MEISYANSKIRKICTDDKTAQKVLGVKAKFLQQRLDRMLLVENLAELRNAPGDYHELTGDRKGQIACSITGQLRLIFTPDHEPVPAKPDGGLDWSKVTAVTNLEIVDYH